MSVLNGIAVPAGTTGSASATLELEAAHGLAVVVDVTAYTAAASLTIADSASTVGNVATITSTGKEPIRHWVATTSTGNHSAKYYAGDTTSSVLVGAIPTDTGMPVHC